MAKEALEKSDPWFTPPSFKSKLEEIAINFLAWDYSLARRIHIQLIKMKDKPKWVEFLLIKLNKPNEIEDLQDRLLASVFRRIHFWNKKD